MVWNTILRSDKRNWTVYGLRSVKWENSHEFIFLDINKIELEKENITIYIYTQENVLWLPSVLGGNESQHPASNLDSD